MAQTFLGSGWAFPIRCDETTQCIEVAAYEESVRQSIGIILSTAKGERAMRPDFGCGIHELVFANGGPETCHRVAEEVHESLLRWESRIDVEDVRVWEAAHGSVLHIQVTYMVRATNNVFNLVYPFYLEGGA